MAIPPQLALFDGVRIPQLVFGVAGLPAADTAKAVRTAIETGFRGIDTASGNEAEVAAALAASEVARDDLFVSTKLSGESADETLRAFERSLAVFGRLDLCLLQGSQVAVDAWRALGSLRDEGRVRAIGVADVSPAGLRRLIGETGVVPAINQVELHPWLQQVPLREFHETHGIVTGASSPLARGALLVDETVTALAAKYGKGPAQIVLRWHLQLGTVPVPRSATTTRIRENFEVFDFELAEDDLMVLAELDNGTRVGSA